jgi:hypothetical protein
MFAIGIKTNLLQRDWPGTQLPLPRFAAPNSSQQTNGHSGQSMLSASSNSSYYIPCKSSVHGQEETNVL